MKLFFLVAFTSDSDEYLLKGLDLHVFGGSHKESEKYTVLRRRLHL